MPFELPLPTKRTVLPLSMHAVNAAKHPTKPATLVDGQESGSVIGVWLSQIIFVKHRNNSFAKIGTWLHGMWTRSCECNRQCNHLALYMQADERP
jgi:hypothetical protein